MGCFSHIRSGRWILITLTVFLLSLANIARSQVQPLPEDENIETREVSVGSLDTIEFDFQPSRVDPVQKGILKIERIGSELAVRVSPIKAGITDVVVYDLQGKLRRKIKYVVTATDLSLQVTQMRRLLDTVEGLSIASVGDKIVLDGELVVPKDLDRVLNVVGAYGGCKGSIICLLQISKVSQRAIGRRIQDEINRQPGSVNVTVRVASDTFFLEGVVDSEADKIRAEDIAKTYVPEVLVSRSVSEGILRSIDKLAIRNLIDVNEAPAPPPPKTVRVTFHFVEISKEYLSSAFLKWAPTLSADAGFDFGSTTTGGVGADANGSLVGTIANLIPRLQKGTNGGYARVLFSSVGIGLENSLISLSRQDQTPFIAQVVNGVPVTGQASAGISIGVRPVIVGNDLIRLDDLEFSFAAVSGAGAGGQPATRTTQFKNQVSVRSGDSAVLGGLISNNMSLDVDKDPDDPGSQTGNAIFTLLRSKAFRRNKSQFVVFVTPQIVPDAAKGTEDIKKKIIGNNRKTRKIYR